MLVPRRVRQAFGFGHLGHTVKNGSTSLFTSRILTEAYAMQIARDSNVPAEGIRHAFSHRQGVLGSLSGRLAALTRNAPGPSSAWHATATRDRREAVCPQFARTGFIGVWRVFKLLVYLTIPAGLRYYRKIDVFIFATDRFPLCQILGYSRLFTTRASTLTHCHSLLKSCVSILVDLSNHTGINPEVKMEGRSCT